MNFIVQIKPGKYEFLETWKIRIFRNLENMNKAFNCI